MVSATLSVVFVVYCSLMEGVFGKSIGSGGKTIHILQEKRDVSPRLENAPMESTNLPSSQEGTKNSIRDAEKQKQINVNKRFLFLNLKLTLTADMEGGSRRRYEVTLPAPQIMGVFDAYVEAASLLRDTYSNAQNPFNLSLRYSGTDDCLQIIHAFGLEADETHSWVMDIRNYDRKTVFRGECLPDRHQIKVGPFYEIALTYTRRAEH